MSISPGAMPPGAVAASLGSHASSEGPCVNTWLQEMRGSPIIRRNSSLRIDPGASPWNSRPGATAASFAAVRPKPGPDGASPWKQAIVATRSIEAAAGPTELLVFALARRTAANNAAVAPTCWVCGGKPGAGYSARSRIRQIVGHPRKRCSQGTQISQKMAGALSENHALRQFWQPSIA